MLRDRYIASVTRGPFVHVEVVLGKGDTDTRAYAAFDGVSGFMPSNTRYKNRGGGARWTLVKYALPPTGYEKIYALILHILAMNLSYNHRDLWQCVIKTCLPFESDLDCSRPDTWERHGGVFCSQVALLLLRRATRMGVIAPFPDNCTRLIEETNSRGCSPNDLFRILTNQKKIT